MIRARALAQHPAHHEPGHPDRRLEVEVDAPCRRPRRCTSPSTPSRATPALLTSTSMPPKRSTTLVDERVAGLAVGQVDRPRSRKRPSSSGRPPRRRSRRSPSGCRWRPCRLLEEGLRRCPAPSPRLPPVITTVAARVMRCLALSAQDLAAAHLELLDEPDPPRAAAGAAAPRTPSRIAASSASVSAPGCGDDVDGDDLAGHRVGACRRRRASSTPSTDATSSSIGSGCTLAPPTLMISRRAARRSAIRPSRTSTRSPVATPFARRVRAAVVAEHADARAGSAARRRRSRNWTSASSPRSSTDSGRPGTAVADRDDRAELGAGVDVRDARAAGRARAAVSSSGPGDGLAAERDLLAAAAPAAVCSSRPPTSSRQKVGVALACVTSTSRIASIDVARLARAGGDERSRGWRARAAAPGRRRTG